MEDILSQRPCQAWTISTVSGMRGMHSCKMEKLVVLNQFGGKQNNSPLSDTYHLCLPSLDVLDLIEHRCYWKNELNVDCNFTWFVVTVPNITVLPPLSSHHCPPTTVFPPLSSHPCPPTTVLPPLSSHHCPPTTEVMGSSPISNIWSHVRRILQHSAKSCGFSPNIRINS